MLTGEKSMNRKALQTLCVALAITTAALASGCMSVAQVGLDYATTKVIDGSGSVATLDGRNVELACHTEISTQPSQSGFLVFRLKAANGWPNGWQPTQFSFRPQASSSSFDFVEIDREGTLLRAIGKNALQPQVETIGDERVIRFRLTKISTQPYEALVRIQNGEGRRANLAIRSIVAR